MKEMLKRFKSPVLWVGIIGLVYSVVIVPSFPNLPDWTSVAGFITAIFGIANNPTDPNGF